MKANLKLNNRQKLANRLNHDGDLIQETINKIFKIQQAIKGSYQGKKKNKWGRTYMVFPKNDEPQIKYYLDSLEDAEIALEEMKLFLQMEAQDESKRIS